MTPDVLKWHELIREYRRLRLGAGRTAQSRGQRFNEVIAEVMRCWGIEAETSVRGTGEIDVVFQSDGVRFVLEAKWQKKKADAGQIAKLQKRVRQRISGTYGIFLSMSGFSKGAIADVADGERLEVLLLDASHWEAMLAGLVPPQELLRLVLDHAAYHGKAHASLATLLATSKELPHVDFGPPSGLTRDPVTTAVDGLTAEVVLSGIASNQHGVACRGDDRLLVTTSRGILDVDLGRSTAAFEVPVPDCHRNPVPLHDGSVLVTRRYGVGRFSGEELSVVGGGATGDNTLVLHPDGGVWLLDNGHPLGPGAAIIKLGNQVGDEERYALDWPPASAWNAAWIAEHVLLSTGNSGILISDILTGEVIKKHNALQGGPLGLLNLGDGAILTADGAAVAYRTNIDNGTSEHLADLPLGGSLNELARGDNGDVYVATYHEAPGAGMVVGVVRLRGQA